MTKTGSELTSEMVGPAGSTSEGAFSRGGSACEEEELCWPLDELLEDWAWLTADKSPASRHETAAENTANDRILREVMCGPCLQV